jgi:hypothetical protein
MFYRLREELEKPGAFAVWETCLHDLESPVAQHNLRDDAFPDFEPEFQPVLLSRDSSLVDFIGSGGAVGGQGLLVSEKVLDIFARMKLPPYQPYPLEVVHRGRPVADRYYWVQILALDNYEWIDFSRSRFTLKSYFDTDDSEGAPVEIRSAKELKGMVAAKAEEDVFVRFTKLTFTAGYARSPFDLFYLDRLGGPSSSFPIINQKLKAALERERVVGYRLSELPHIGIGA